MKFFTMAATVPLAALLVSALPAQARIAFNGVQANAAMRQGVKSSGLPAHSTKITVRSVTLADGSIVKIG